jgi:hypothetical protein
MITKAMLFAVLAACGVHTGDSNPNDPPVFKPPPEAPQEDQHFCCQSVDLDKKSGEGCVSLSVTHIDTCSEVLYCGGDWGKSNGTTKCLD